MIEVQLILWTFSDICTIYSSTSTFTLVKWKYSIIQARSVLVLFLAMDIKTAWRITHQCTLLLSELWGTMHSYIYEFEFIQWYWVPCAFIVHQYYYKHILQHHAGEPKQHYHVDYSLVVSSRNSPWAWHDVVFWCTMTLFAKSYFYVYLTY